MAPNRTYGKPHPEAKVEKPLGAVAVRLGETFLGYLLPDNSIAAHAPGVVRRPINSDDDRTMMSVRLRELERDLNEVGRESWPIYLPLVAQTAAGRWKIEAARAVTRAQKRGEANVQANITEGAKAVLGHLLHSFPECSLADAVDAVETAFIEPRHFTAAKLGEAVGLTDARRTKLDIRTFRAVDVSPAVTKRRNGEKNKSRKTDTRRENGVPTREQWLAENNISTICRELGISRTTFYQRKKAGLDPLTGLPPATVAGVAKKVAAPVNQSAAAPHCMSPGPVNPATHSTPEQVDRSGRYTSFGGIASAATVNPNQPTEPDEVTGGGQASSLPPAPLDTVTESPERNEPMTEQTSAIETVQAAGPDAPPSVGDRPYRDLSEALKSLLRAGDDATVERLIASLAEISFQRGVTEGFAREQAVRQRRVDVLLHFVNHPAWPTAHDLVSRITQADRTVEEIDAILSVIGTAQMDDVAGDMAVALFKQGHEPVYVARALLNSSGMRGRA